MLYFIIVIASTFGGGFMISLEETAKDTTLDSKNLTLVHKQIILSIRAIDWGGLFSYTLRDSFTAENLELDYSGLLIPKKGVSPDNPSVSFSFLISSCDYFFSSNVWAITLLSLLKELKLAEGIDTIRVGNTKF